MPPSRFLPFLPCLFLVVLQVQAQSGLPEPEAGHLYCRAAPLLEIQAASDTAGSLPVHFSSYFGPHVRPAGRLVHPDGGFSMRAKLRQRNYGAQLGYQRGAYNFLEIGFEHHWRTISLSNPRMFSVGGSFGYNFWDNTAEYKVGAWYKWGRIALTYGGNLVYATNFEQGKLGVAPVVGFRLLGFHLTTGYNLLWGGDADFTEYNKFYVSLRYYFPIDNTFKWRKKNKDGRDKKKNKKDKKELKWPWQKK